MIKAISILKQIKDLSGWIKCGAELPYDNELDEAIYELEAQKAKSCKARSIVAMLFWEWKKQCRNCEQYNDHTFAREQKRSEAYYCFQKAYKMLKDTK